MTEHSKIPLPSDGGAKNRGPKNSESFHSSLLERASRSFGLEGLNSAPMPSRLADAPIKRARAATRRLDSEQPAKKSEQTIELGEPAKPSVSPETALALEPEPLPPTSQRIPEELRPAEPDIGAALPVPVRANGIVRIVEDAKKIPAVILGGKLYPVDREHLRNQSLIVPEDPITELLEEFRIVKRRLLASSRESDNAAARRILICSPHSGEGKTFCSSNLAIAMAAERGTEVLLVDADFAKPSLLSTFGLPAGPGLMDALADPSIELASLPIRTDIANLWVLPAGDRSLVDSEYLASPRTGEILDRFTVGASNRIMIFDTPPALAASPAAELAKHVGQVVLVARADFTGHTALEDAYRLLSAGCPDIKLMLNAAQFSPSGRRFGNYYGYEG